MVTGNFVHQVHDHLVVIVGQINLLENRSKLKLVWSHLVVAGLNWDAQFIGFVFQIHHEHGYTFRN